MDQLYEAMPIPSSSDEGDATPQRQRGGASAEDFNLDVSAHNSFSDSASASVSSSDVSDHEVNADGQSYHRVFTTSSSPQELHDFLAELLEVAEALQARLSRLQGHDTLSASQNVEQQRHPSDAAAAAPPDTSSSPKDANTASTSSKGKRKESTRTGRVSDTTSDSFNGNSEGVGGPVCQGMAKLRGRLRKETDNLRRAVEGLRNAGCSRDATNTSAADVAEASIPPAVFHAAISCAQCNSVSHFEGILACLEHEDNVTGVYVPVSGHIGPAQCQPAAASSAEARPQRSAIKPAFAAHVRIEVDVVACNEHRWIKVKTATARNLELEAAALELNGSTPFTDMLLELCARARRACLPHRRCAQVAVVLLHRPPAALEEFFNAHGIAWTCLHISQHPKHTHDSHHQHHRLRAKALAASSTRSLNCLARAAAGPHALWLPPLSHPPSLVCLDTTALVTLCSQSCFDDAMPLPVRLDRLSKFRVLQEQQRKEGLECAAVSAVMEPALRTYTRWCTEEEMNAGMRRALLRGGETCAVAAAMKGREEESSGKNVCAEGAGGGTEEDNENAERSRCVPAWLLRAVDLSWLPPLQQAAKARPSDAVDTTTYAHPSNPLSESALLVELNTQHRSSPTHKPNWFIADITYEEFRWILETFAGPDEVARAVRLLELVTVVDTSFLRERMNGVRGEERNTTAASPSAEVAAPPLFSSVEFLKLSGKVSLRNKIVFGLADALDAVVVTSNEQLCHASREQGVCVEACFHPSRSLTEQKLYQLRRRSGPGKPPAVL